MSGFVYIWRDRKHNKYYVGSHWGSEDDGYICSSTNMRENKRHRPNDFRREILARVITNRVDLLKEEQRWLDMIKPEEFGRKYYNINDKVFQRSWWANDETKRQVIEKLKVSQKIAGRKRSAEFTHCPQGHEYNEENTYHDNRGSRRCKKCNAERINQKYQNLTLEEKALHNQQSSENYYKNHEENLRKQKEYAEAHREHKREYDRINRAKATGRKRKAIQNETPEQREKRLEMKRLSYHRCKSKEKEQVLFS